MENQRMSIAEAVKITGLDKGTIYKIMDLGIADLGCVLPGNKKKTYVLYKEKVRKFVEGGNDSSQVDLICGRVETMNFLLTNVLSALPGGVDALRRCPK